MTKVADLFETCQADRSDDVAEVHGLACDNAAATMDGKFVRGCFNEEFLSHWFGSVQSILAAGDNVTPAARQFFESHGVAY